MPPVDDLITTYLTACELEGKSPDTLRTYRESLRSFRHLGARLGLPDEISAVNAIDVALRQFHQHMREATTYAGSSASLTPPCRGTSSAGGLMLRSPVKRARHYLPWNFGWRFSRHAA